MDKWLVNLLKQILNNISPEIRGLIVEFVKKLDAKAKGTPNAWDDIAVGILAFLLQVDLN